MTLTSYRNEDEDAEIIIKLIKRERERDRERKERTGFGFRSLRSRTCKKFLPQLETAEGSSIKPL